MKKLGNVLGSSISSLSNSAAAAAQQINRTLAEQGGSVVAPQPTSQPAGGEKQYLRLPIESAKKLRWYDKGDVAPMAKQHMREKHQLLDTITALKKIMIRNGFTDGALDAEARALLASSDELRETDEGVERVLMVSLQDHMEELTGRLAEQARQLEELRSRLANAPPTFDLGGEDAAAAAPPGAATSTQPPPPIRAGVPPAVADALAAAVAAVEGAEAGAAAVARAAAQQERALAVAETAETVRAALQAQTAAPALQAEGAGPTCDALSSQEAGALHREVASEREHSAALAAKLAVAESERRRQADEAVALAAQLAAARGEAEAAQARCAALAEASSAAVADATRARAAAEEARAALDRQRQEVTRLQQAVGGGGQRGGGAGGGPSPQQAADMLQRYKDLALQMEERSLDAERKLSLAEARVAALEGSCKEAREELRDAQRDAQRQAAAGAREVASLEARARAAEAAAADAERRALEGGGGPGAGKRLALLEEERGALQRQLAAARMQAEHLEKRLAGAEAREARLLAELREGEAVAAERDELAAQVAVLRDRVDEIRGERGQLEHLRKVAAQLETAKAAVDEQLLTTAQLVTALEERLRQAHARAEAAATAAGLAEGRAKAAEVAIATEVAERMAAVGTNRALWPAPARDACEKLERKLEAVSGVLEVVRGELSTETRLYQQEARRQAEAQRRVMELEDRLVRLEREAGNKVRELESLLDYAQKDADACREIVGKLEYERDEARAALAAVGNGAGAGAGARPGRAASGAQFGRRASGVPTIHPSGSSGVLNSPSAATAALVASSADGSGGGGAGGGGAGAKWQVQNKVGSGGLYGLTDADPSGAAGGVPAASGPAAASTAERPAAALPAQAAPSAAPVDLVYLKNVVLKFLEASAAGRAAERDALLPAVAAVVGATPAEFAAMRRVLAATAPTTTQVFNSLRSIRL